MWPMLMTNHSKAHAKHHTFLRCYLVLQKKCRVAPHRSPVWGCTKTIDEEKAQTAIDAAEQKEALDARLEALGFHKAAEAAKASAEKVHLSMASSH